MEKKARAEIQVDLPGGLVRVEEEDPDLYAAIDRAVDRLETQVKRFRERRYVGKRHSYQGPRLPRCGTSGPAQARGRGRPQDRPRQAL